jgi:hypothetical protein
MTTRNVEMLEKFVTNLLSCQERQIDWCQLKRNLDKASLDIVHGYIIHKKDGGYLSVELMWWDTPTENSPDPIVIPDFLIESIRGIFSQYAKKPDWKGTMPHTITPATWSKSNGVVITGDAMPW